MKQLWGWLTPQEPEKEPMNGEKFLIVGLGNPDRQYLKNRHNIGFMAIDRLAEQAQIPVNRLQNKAMTGNGRFADQAIILAKPMTYMNLSGDAVGPLAAYYQIPKKHVFIIYDELDIPFGEVRLREKGSAGGHNGIKSIIQHLGPEVPRLRLGIGRPPGQMPAAAYVLQDFSRTEEPVLHDMLTAVPQIVETYLREGINLAMTRYNGKIA